MEIYGLFVPILLVAVCGIVLLATFGWWIFWLLIQLGVIVREARRPPHIDAGDYRLDQGRDVGDDQRRSKP
jgi:hypothetical protein